MLRPLALIDMGAAAQVFPGCRVWGRFDEDELGGIIAFRHGWIEQLYVRRRGACTKRAGSCRPRKPTERGTRRRSPTRGTSGRDRSRAHSTAYHRSSRGAAQSVTTDSISHCPGDVAAKAMRWVWPGSMASVSSQ